VLLLVLLLVLLRLLVLTSSLLQVLLRYMVDVEGVAEASPSVAPGKGSRKKRRGSITYVVDR